MNRRAFFRQASAGIRRNARLLTRWNNITSTPFAIFHTAAIVDRDTAE
jgi:hypothetical protein